MNEINEIIGKIADHLVDMKNKIKELNNKIINLEKKIDQLENNGLDKRGNN